MFDKIIIIKQFKSHWNDIEINLFEKCLSCDNNYKNDNNINFISNFILNYFKKFK